MMYNRVGRSLLVVGRQLRQRLCENPRNNVSGTIACGLSTSLHGTDKNNYVFQRNYCKGSSAEKGEDVPILMAPDEEASIKLKDYLAIPENERIYKIIELEVEVMRQNSEKVPAKLRLCHWYELVNLESRSKRKRYLAFLWGLEKKKENDMEAKDVKRKLYEERSEPDTPYRLGDNTFFLRIYETTMNNMWNGRLINRIMFGQPIVFDCGYESYMNRRETQTCARQLQLSFAANRCHDDPFDIYFCNTNNSGGLMKAVHRYIPPLYNSDFPLHVKTESYLDLFDKNRLIYLTPHCQREMVEFDHDAVYIIGAFVDKSRNEPVSLAKAKKEGLRMMKFPLDRFLQWGCSSGKNLTLNAVINILLDLRLTGSWDKALQNVPRRKLFEARESAKERQLRRHFNQFAITTNETEPIHPVQPIIPKVDQRFNNDQYTRTNYNRDFGHKDGRDSKFSSYSQRSNRDGAEIDYTAKGRSKYLKNSNH